MTNYSIIAAISEKGVIGFENRIPWHLPEDLKLFKKLTTGNIIIMGRKTFDSIGRALPGRTTIVITRTPKDFLKKHSQPRLLASDSLEAALSEAEKTAKQNTPEAKIFIAGGASIYTQAMDKARRLYISKIPGDFEGDTYFPEFSTEDWNLESTEALNGFKLESYLRK